MNNIQTPAHLIEAEQHVLGSLLLENKIFAKIKKILLAADFS